MGSRDWGLGIRDSQKLGGGIRDGGRRSFAPANHQSRITNHESRPYLMLITVWVAWSWVEIICALAWKLRCAVIMLTSCSVRSTVEASSAPAWMRPKSDESGAPLRGVPEEWVAAHMLLPTACRPCGLTKLVSTIWPRATSSPLE